MNGKCVPVSNGIVRGIVEHTNLPDVRVLGGMTWLVNLTTYSHKFWHQVDNTVWPQIQWLDKTLLYPCMENWESHASWSRYGLLSTKLDWACARKTLPGCWGGFGRGFLAWCWTERLRFCTTAPRDPACASAASLGPHPLPWCDLRQRPPATHAFIHTQN